MKMTVQEKIETLQEVLGMMDEIATKLRSLGSPRIDAYCLAAFEGAQASWLGKDVRDYLEEELAEARRALEGAGQEDSEEGE